MRGGIAFLSTVLLSCGSAGRSGEDAVADWEIDLVPEEDGVTTDSPPDTAPVDPAIDAECVGSGDCDDGDPCTMDACNPVSGECWHADVDEDGDGHAATSVAGTACPGGDDCRDYDELIHPGAAPDCSGTMDMDCDGLLDGDEDRDGHMTPECPGGDDCDDGDEEAYPGAGAWDCTSDDHDCNGLADEDNDGDGHGREWCGGGDDCDDTDPAVHPGAPEAECDGKDTDCDGRMSIVEDADGDGAPNGTCMPGTWWTDCDDADPEVHPGATEASCDGKDTNCDGHMTVVEDWDMDGYANPACASTGVDVDCDDDDDAINPGAVEACDTVDDDCDGTWSDGGADDDGDGHLDASCGGDDCDDLDAGTYGAASEICTGGLDEDCDGVIDCHVYERCSASGICEVDWVTVSPGIFTMGSPTGEPGRDAGETQHVVTLTRAFQIQVTEVTQSQFEAVMGYQTAHDTACGGRCPVEGATWHEAAAYCNGLSAAAGYGQCYTCTGGGWSVSCSPDPAHATLYDCPGYRLPTEAEWEYAARAGTTEATYNGTSTLVGCTVPNLVLEPIAWFCGNSGFGINEVGLKLPNAWKLYDMIGNVWEMCGDWYDAYPGDVTDPWGPASGSYRVVRGGAWADFAEWMRSAKRVQHNPAISADDGGFRPVRTLP